MEKKLVTEAERFLNSRHHDRRRTQVIRGLALLVVAATVSALIMPAVTMSNETECGLEEHIHTESCYAIQQVAPQPVPACTVGESGAIVIHTHDEYCYDSLGNLICDLPEVEAHVHGPECCQEHRTLICDQVADPGHQHSAACYSYVRVENVDVAETAPVTATEYICGLQEGEGAHRHTEECCPEERAAEPLCGLEETGDVYDDAGNLIQQGHTHTRECWYERVHEKLICGLEESEDEYDEEGNLIRAGHHHDRSCWLTGDALCYQYGCGQHESAGHVHTDSCTVQVELQPEVQVDAQGEEWVKNLICGEEERAPGHVHIDECYEITQVLTCRTQELQPHTHSAACYDETGALVCGKPEVLVHQHTEACFVTPEGGPEPTEVLICGMEEHTHTDLCYVKTAPGIEKYYCGMEEHIHSQECYFESGAVKCTIPEHVHADECLTPPLDEGVEVEEVSVEMDETFTHDTELFHMEISVTGTAVTRTRIMELEEPEVPMAQMPILSGFLSFLFGPFMETASAASIEEFDEPEGAPSGLTVVENDSQEPYEPMPAEPDPAADSLEETIVFNVEEVLSGEDYNAIVAEMEKVVDEDTAIGPVKVIEITASLNGEQLDLTGCEVAVELQPTQALAAAVSNEGISTMDLDEAADDGVSGGGNLKMSVTVVTSDGEQDSQIVEANETAEEQVQFEPVRFTMSGAESLVYGVRSSFVVNPEFSVQFYINIEEPLSDQKEEGVNEQLYLPFIDTSSRNGGKAQLPENGNQNLAQKYLKLDDKGNVQYSTSLKELYKSETREFNPKLEESFNVDYLNSLRSNDHYAITELWILKEGCDSKSTNEADWIVKKDNLELLKFTNDPDKAAADTSGNTILIEQDNKSVIRLVYEGNTVDGALKNGATFYDYDISDGTYTQDGTKKIMYTESAGINSVENCNATTKLAFGNSNAGTQYGTQPGNQANDDGFYGCTFELVETNKLVNGVPVFTVSAPDLFTDQEQVGKTKIENINELVFNRRGDTYTLSSVTGTDVNELENFGFSIPNWNKTRTIWSNSFWPMDSAATWGADGHDIKFGSAKDKDNNCFQSSTLPTSDDGEDHNSYFGMKTAVQFKLAKEYIGPLEFYFYGDDDMWVFLSRVDGAGNVSSSQLVCDIGGVHSSVGEYVDLWDYIDGGRENHDLQSYRLDIFYTERGASGSTCWMQFTVPELSEIRNTAYNPGNVSLRIQKHVEGGGSSADQEFAFELQLTGLQNQYSLEYYNAKGELTSSETIGDARKIITLKDGEYADVIDLPTGVGYMITEHYVSDNCETTVEGANIRNSGVLAEGTITEVRTDVVYTNTFLYTLPETGGGTRAQWYTLACAPMALAAGCLWYKKRTHGEGAEDGA